MDPFVTFSFYIYQYEVMRMRMDVAFMFPYLLTALIFYTATLSAGNKMMYKLAIYCLLISLHVSFQKKLYFQSVWPSIRIVKVGLPSDIGFLRMQCTHSEQLVSIQSPEHVIWLDTQVKTILGDTATSGEKGIPLAYDYSLSNEYYDLNDQTRSIQNIFDELRTHHKWGGDYNLNQTSSSQYYAGFGWNNRGIEDWGNSHTTYAVICEAKLQGEYVMLILEGSLEFYFGFSFTFYVSNQGLNTQGISHRKFPVLQFDLSIFIR